MSSSSPILVEPGVNYFFNQTLKQCNIKRNNLVGIEQMPHMYTIACTNMILRGDGKSNLYQGSCFDEAIFDAVKELKPTVGLINPPYAQGNGKEELVFVNNMLNLLVMNTLKKKK
jgi:hypothetical protein